jgi:hypothetical protein
MATFGTGLKDFFTAFGRTLKELADSRKAIVTGLASSMTLAVTAFPALSNYADAVTKVDVLLGILVIAFGVIDAVQASKSPVVVTGTSSTVTTSTVDSTTAPAPVGGSLGTPLGG